MRGTGAGIRDGAAGRIAELEERRPEWRGWLALVREAVEALEDPAWDRCEVSPHGTGAAGPGIGPASAPPGARPPLLHRAVLRLDAAALRALLAALLRAAGGTERAASLRRLRPAEEDALHLAEALLRGDRERIAAIAARGEAEPDALAAVAGLAVLPPLHACWRRAQPRLPAAWPHGWCPCCGAWPVLAELRGLDRARLLRCGLCGGAWEAPWLRCAYCGEARHERLGSLVPEQELETRRVETCASCRGYLKSLTALRASPPAELLLRDLESVELDLVAVERGWQRPRSPGFAPDVRLAALAVM